MARQAKSSRSPASPKRAAGGTLIGMFIGLVLGVCIAAVIVWYINQAPLPFNASVQTGKQAPRPTAPAEPVALPGKPGDQAQEKRFQFYDILPGKADAVPDKAGKPPEVVAEAPKAELPKDTPKEVQKDVPKEAPKETGKESKVPLFLQAGSFSTAQDADNQKAKLAFMGVEAVVQQVMVEEKTFYRVRIGPYLKLDELNKVRSELAKSGMEAQLSK